MVIVGPSPLVLNLASNWASSPLHTPENGYWGWGGGWCGVVGEQEMRSHLWAVLSADVPTDGDDGGLGNSFSFPTPKRGKKEENRHRQFCSSFVRHPTSFFLFLLNAVGRRVGETRWNLCPGRAAFFSSFPIPGLSYIPGLKNMLHANERTVGCLVN